MLAVEKTTSGNETKFIMFVEDNDKNSLLWSGPKNGLEGTKSHFGFQAVQPDRHRAAKPIFRSIDDKTLDSI